jgi:hypothetical protein
MVVQGKIPHMKAGNKYLINLEILEKFMAGGLLTEDAVKSAE